MANVCTIGVRLTSQLPVQVVGSCYASQEDSTRQVQMSGWKPNLLGSHVKQAPALTCPRPQLKRYVALLCLQEMVSHVTVCLSAMLGASSSIHMLHHVLRTAALQRQAGAVAISTAVRLIKQP